MMIMMILWILPMFCVEILNLCRMTTVIMLSRSPEKKKVESKKGLHKPRLKQESDIKPIKKKPNVKLAAKVPVKISAPISRPTSTTIKSKQDFLNLLELIDFKRIIRDILQEELHKAPASYAINDPLDNDIDLREDDPMDIDVARLESLKDWLSIDGNVNGILIQCLADSCANVSFIQKEAAEELGLLIDTGKKHNITGASGSNKTLGVARNVAIEVAPECIIKEDLAVLDNYKYREIGLSHACLKRYNYDIHESRDHIAF